MRLLGIDPGLGTCGYAVIDIVSPDEKLIEAGTVVTDDSLPLEKRLDQIAGDFESILKKFKPDIVAVEQLYSHYTHPKTAILMGHARGVILHKCAQSKTEVKSFSATKIKKSVTGNGRASKEQIQRSIQVLMKLNELPSPPDVADAMAAALCCGNAVCAYR